MVIVPPRELVRRLIDAAVLTKNIDSAEISLFAEALFCVEAERWAIVRVEPLRLFELTKAHGNFGDWTQTDNYRSGQYQAFTTEPPPTCLHFLTPSRVSIIDGRHRLVARKRLEGIDLATPALEIDRVLRLLSAVKLPATVTPEPVEKP